MKSSTTMQIIQSHAIMNFIYAFWNLPPGYILAQVFGDVPEDLTHITDKLLENGDGSIFTLMGSLDERKREKIIRWVMETHKGIDVANVARYYCKEEDCLKRLDSLTKEGQNKFNTFK